MPKRKKDKIEKSAIREFLTTLLWALSIAFVFKTFFFQPFHIPSESMQPELVKGDYIITSKYSLGYGRYAAAPLPFPVNTGRLFERPPKRGDVIVFRIEGGDKNIIKRLVGLPGDQIQMQSGVLYINGLKTTVQAQGEETRLDSMGLADITNVALETFPEGHEHRIYDDILASKLDDTDLFTVPAGHYFFMGDNRDHSGDSRVSPRLGGIGYVPAENLVGKAEIILASGELGFSILKPWTWSKIRGDRLFKGIH